MDRSVKHHLMIVKPRYIEPIITGRKTIECRLSRTLKPPFGCVERGDTLWLKASGGPIVATIRARRVSYVHPVTPDALDAILDQYGPSILAAPLFFENNRSARYGTIIHLSHVRHVQPIRIAKQDRRAWLRLLEPPRDVGVTVRLERTGQSLARS